MPKNPRGPISVGIQLILEWRALSAEMLIRRVLVTRDMAYPWGAVPMNMSTLSWIWLRKSLHALHTGNVGCHPCPRELLHVSSMLAGAAPNGIDFFAVRAARSTTEETAVTLEQTVVMITGGAARRKWPYRRCR